MKDMRFLKACGVMFLAWFLLSFIEITLFNSHPGASYSTFNFFNMLF
jgi:hypothetical protein